MSAEAILHAAMTAIEDRSATRDTDSGKSMSRTVDIFNQLTDGELEVWQVAGNVNQVLRFTYERPLLIPTASTDSIDFPSEWFMHLKWAVAAELGPQYGVKAERQLVLEAKSNQTLEAVMGHDVERDSMSLQPDFN